VATNLLNITTLLGESIILTTPLDSEHTFVYERLRQGITWPEMYSELKAYVRSCDSCQRNKTSNQKPIGLLKPLEIRTERFEQVSMDFSITLPVTKENHDVVMVIVDKLTKLVMFIPTRTDMDTVETAKKFFNHWFRWFGLPKKIISDRDGKVQKQILERTLQANADEARNVYKSPPTDIRANGEGK
jgi:Integrase zinc binding domain